MPRPHREIPSQRLAVARSQAADVATAHRSRWWALGVWVAGWLLFAYPIVVLTLLSLVVMTGSLDHSVTASGVVLGIVGFVLVAAMLAFPILLGFAVKTRRRALWIPALLTGALSVASCIYLLVEWVIPMGSF